VARFSRVAPDSTRYGANLRAILHNLVDTHGFGLTSQDSASLQYVFSAFYIFGPGVSYSSRPSLYNPTMMGRAGTNWTWRVTVDSNGRLITRTDSTGRITSIVGAVTSTDTTRRAGAMSISVPATIITGIPGQYPTFGTLMTETDAEGVQRGWLASDENFRALKDFQARNLLVPVVGDFGGPKALRSIGRYLKERGAKVDVFYLSNVEQYLFQSDAWTRFYANVSTLPTDASSSFIRSFSNLTRTMTPRNTRSRMAQTSSSIDAVLRAFYSGGLTSYNQLVDIGRR
jgi:YD repeat-containing protein